MFGEKGFLFGGSASATVIACAADTEIQGLDKVRLERLFFIKPELAGGFYKRLARSIEGRVFQRNHNVLQRYSALLVKMVTDGDLSRDSLFATTKGNAPIVRVARPVRKESLSELSALAAQVRK